MIRAYEQDYAGWVEDTAAAIEQGRFSEINCEALADEVRDLGKSERSRIESALTVLVMHLLKTKYQPMKRTRSWEATIGIQRKHVIKFLKESPSLRPELPQFLSDAYEQARVDAAEETGLDIDTFPATCEWTLTEVLG